MTHEKQLVQKTIDAVLAPIGFKRSGSVWTRSRNGLTQAVGLQKSQHGAQFYLNVGVGINSLGVASPIREKDLHIRLRADSLFNPLQRESWVRCLDFESERQEADRARDLRGMVLETVVPQLELWQSEDALRASIKDGELSNALISADARALLSSPSS